MLTLKQCAESAGLDVDELVLGVAPSARHRALLQSYRLNLHRGRAAVLRMMVCDLRGHLDVGAHVCAADLLVVLRLFLSEQGDIRHHPVAGQRALRLVGTLRARREAPARTHAVTPLKATLP